MSVITLTDDSSFGGRGYTNYGQQPLVWRLSQFAPLTRLLFAGFEYDPGADGRITWSMNATETWQLNASAMGPDEAAQIGQRLVSEEPMVRFSRRFPLLASTPLLTFELQAIILNLAISTKFQPPNVRSSACFSLRIVR